MYKKYGKLICIYDLENHKTIKYDDSSKSLLDDKGKVLCFQIENEEDFIYNDKNISFENFPWKTYYKINKELLSNDKKNNTKINAWNHWFYNGKNEERSFSYTNNTNGHRARFGNLFFLNMCLHLFSIKYNLKSSYKYETEFNELGVYFHKGSKIYSKNYLLTDYNFENLLESDASAKNVIINNDVWFHTKRFCTIIKTYFTENKLFSKIIEKNHYRDRYNNNNDLFIHIRLGDVENITKNLFLYYENTIQLIKFNNGYIASDNFDHEICLYLSKKHNLKFINENEIKTIMFASTCKHIILSGGTFSWLIAFLAINSKNIFYPELKEKWYGDIFSFNNWNAVNLDY